MAWVEWLADAKIEVVTFTDGHRTILSDSYAPPRDPPDWVKDVEARLAGPHDRPRRTRER